MYTNPKESFIRPTCRLIVQFQEKGYKCEEIVEQDSTILYLTHEKKSSAQDHSSEPHKTFRIN